MRAAVYYNNNDVRVEERPKPKINPDEILIKTHASGICGSDVMEWYRIKKAPLVLGHEVTGTVEEVGSQVKKFKIGDRVSVAHHVPCNTCHYCLRGDHTVCETLHTTNFDPGGFAEFIRVPAINVDRGTFLLPEEISFEEGVLVEPLGCVVRGLRESGFRAGDTVLISGSGISGLLFVQHAKGAGAGKIITTDISEYRLNKAKELGAHAVFNAKDDIPSLVKKINNGRLADIVVVCAGHISVYEQALKSVDKGGTILCFAPADPSAKLSLPLNDFWRNSITILPSYASAPYDTDIAIKLIASKNIDAKKLITQNLGLDEIGLGFKMVASAGESIKVVIDPRR